MSIPFARGTEIAAGTTSADGWTTFLPMRQVAAIEMRVGQNGGPLPFEAIIEFGRTCCIRYTFTRTSRRAFFVFCNREGRFLRLRAEGLWAGEAQGGAEGDELTLQVEEPMTAATL